MRYFNLKGSQYIMMSTMIGKKTANAPSNIAFVKYWGKKNDILRLPANGSISMSLSGLATTTTVEFLSSLTKDDITIDGQQIENEGKRVKIHLDRIRKLASIKTYARVVSQNSFPSSTGLSSSASGFAALTVAATKAAGLTLSEKELSILARLGSGSACRSIPDGFVEWKDGSTDDSSYAVSIFPPDYFDIVDIVALTNTGKKDIPTSEGMKLAHTSPFFQTRIAGMDKKLELCKTYIKNKDVKAFGDLVEQEALNMHAVMMTSNPPLLYWTANTIALMKEIQIWRTTGLEAYFTVNTGQDIHVLCKSADAEAVVARLRTLKYVSDTILSTPSVGTKLSDSHLF
jgi:diphosphomevalonate decarboxylase